MRTLNDHQVNPVNDTLNVTVSDKPGPGGANHIYRITTPDGRVDVTLSFQNGPIAEAGVNGITHEVLLAIVADRLRSFQDGAFKCKENACALTHIEEAQHWLQQRTLKRMRRGVEGMSVV
jgi:hypothetical protein